MKLSRGARRDNLFNSFFRCPSALALICMKLFNVCANKLSLSLSLVAQSPEQSETEWLCVDVAGYKNINVYKPPRSRFTPTANHSLQHLHLWPANHRLQKACICWRSSNHACWWRLAGCGRGADQGHGNCRWNFHTWKLKFSTTKTVSVAFHLNNKEAKRELEVKYNNEILRFCYEPKYLGVTLDRSLTYRRHLESLRKKQ